MGPHYNSLIEEHALSSEVECRCWLHRLASYEKWPHLHTHSACAFTTTGFYCTGRGDEVTCSNCGVTLAQWTSDMRPLIVHRTLGTSTCNYLRQGALASDFPHGQQLTRIRGPDSLIAVRKEISSNLSPATDDKRAASAASQLSYGLLDSYFRKSYADIPQSFFVSLKEFIKIPTATERASSQMPQSRGGGESQLRLPRHCEEDLKFECHRLNTFSGCWEYSRIIDPRELASAGFYYAGPRDRVQCAFCQGLLRNWEPGDRAMALHAQHFSYCRFVQGHDVGNVPIPFSALEQIWPENDGAGDEALGISRSTPRHDDLAVEARRLATFTTWPPTNYHKPEDLASAGFFYIGGQDSVKCFYCDVVISAWPMGSDPWIEHAKRTSSCLFLEQVKGTGFSQQHRDVSSRADGNSLQKHVAVDPREVRARLDSTTVRILLHMEYPADLVREALLKRLSTVGYDHASSEDLLASVFDLHDSRQSSQLDNARVRPNNRAALPVVIPTVNSLPAPVSRSAAAAASNHSSSLPVLSSREANERPQRRTVS